jgi:hypothetical protein
MKTTQKKTPEKERPKQIIFHPNWDDEKSFFRSDRVLEINIRFTEFKKTANNKYL